MINMIDSEFQRQLRAKYNPDGSELRKMQLRMLEMLKFLDCICKANNLTYWLDSGTLLGAVRHGGFLPWDDDIDVCMKREDAEKLKAIMGDKFFDGKYILQTDETDPNYVNSSWVTLRDIHSEYIQDSYLHNRLKYRGLQIDIFIYDKGVDLLIKNICARIQYNFIVLPLLGTRFKFLRPIVNSSHHILEKRIFPFLRKFRFNSKWQVGYGGLFGGLYSENTLFPTSNIKFEGFEFPAPADYVTYLRDMYGDDWNIVPSPDKIKTHNVSWRELE